jgi:hypothetical protein
MRHPHGLRAAAGLKKAIEFVASAQTQNTTLGASLVINKPTGTQEGDLMIAIAGTDARPGRNWSQPSGWNEVRDQGAGTNLMVSHYIAGASEPGSYTFTLSNNAITSGIIITYRNAAFDVVGSIATSVSSGVQTASAVTLTESASTLLAFFAEVGASRTWSSPTSGLISLATDSDGTAPSWALYSEANVVSGSTGSKSATCSSPSGTFGCFLLGIKPS